MKRLAILLFLVIAAALPQALRAATLTLDGYQRADGAITTYLGGSSVDPYFAAKALLAAQDAGMDTKAAAQRWIAWQLPRQREDGRFDRYCLENQRFTACREADADDALMAAWMELLVRNAPPKGLPPPWQASFDKAAAHLETLRDRRTGVYQISNSLQVALLMDNVEISSAFKAVGLHFHLLGNASAAQSWQRRAAQLDRDIERVFWRTARGYLASTQPRDTTDFYPDTVAQIFPLLADIAPGGTGGMSAYVSWMRDHRSTWLQMSETDFPWGLVALVADKMGDQDAITCWRKRSVQFRHGKHWNVLEEALFLSFEARLTPEQALAPAPAGLRCR